ncbi:GNAT family N-acetyltransferase [Flavobacterium hercynium]|uniref:GNAT family N-acetyltransferase n=1 Tax=Flavobacterium hercynium TaxID=387094 RepID=A0A226GTT6_9FLAO|nr:GNAT family N-acetyltransferase [Flavobacterium hercynium]OXA84968.1 GNAT family N-acetyltransferase [Flavobacterium hercynium]SMP35050.1 Acetyltransferase (GNAT) family protein [Flavobacterium hercynium]
MQKIEIQKIALREIEVLKRLGRQTFTETFAEVNSEENMLHYLDGKFSNQKLTAELSNPNSEFYFARLNNEVVGYLKVNFGEAQTELQDPQGLEIERIYVLKQFHGAKIGQHLYEKAVDIAKKSSLNYIWLGVWEENLRALSFYKKNGFVEFDKHIFKLGNDEQTDLLMKLTLEQQ